MMLYIWYYVFTNVPGYNTFVETSTLVERAVCDVTELTPDGTCSTLFCLEAGRFQSNEACETTSGIFFLIFPHLLLSLLTVVCVVVQVRALSKGTREGLPEEGRVAASKTTKTVLVMSVVYVVCNTTTAVWVVVAGYSNLVRDPLSENQEMTVTKGKVQGYYLGMFVFQNTLPLLNSTLSPLILVWRGSALRGFITQGLGRISGGTVVKNKAATQESSL